MPGSRRIPQWRRAELEVAARLRRCGWFARRLAGSKPFDVIAVKLVNGTPCVLAVEVKTGGDWAEVARRALEALGEMAQLPSWGLKPVVVVWLHGDKPRVATSEEELKHAREPSDLPTLKRLCDEKAVGELCGSNQAVALQHHVDC